MQRLVTSLVFSLALLMVAGSPAHAQDVPVTLVVEELRSDQGQVLVNLYLSEDAFLSSRLALWQKAVPVPPGASQVEIELELPLVEFALGVLHDEDGDGEMDTNFIGMPKEGMGASNNPTSRFGPPKWEDALVDSVQPGDTLRIQANYLF